MPFTYILHSDSLNRYYIGATSLTPKERLNYHLTNHNGFTAKAKDWKIVYHFEAPSMTEALFLERKIKKRGAKRFLENQLKY